MRRTGPEVAVKALARADLRREARLFLLGTAIKVHGFEESVSVNLGLPFIRTSVDHGTAFDIAGRGGADETSMVEAIRTATRLARREGLAGADPANRR